MLPHVNDIDVASHLCVPPIQVIWDLLHNEYLNGLSQARLDDMLVFLQIVHIYDFIPMRLIDELYLHHKNV